MCDTRYPAVFQRWHLRREVTGQHRTEHVLAYVDRADHGKSRLPARGFVSAAAHYGRSAGTARPPMFPILVLTCLQRHRRFHRSCQSFVYSPLQRGRKCWHGLSPSRAGKCVVVSPAMEPLFRGGPSRVYLESAIRNISVRGGVNLQRRPYYVVKECQCPKIT